MTTHEDQQLRTAIRNAELVVSCRDFAESLAFFTGMLGFRVDQIFPADSPRTALISGHGVVLRLEVTSEAIAPPARLRLTCDPERVGELILPRSIAVPGGMHIEIVGDTDWLDLPGAARNTELVVTRSDGSGWQAGRAGMQYRDLIPSRLGGRFIASQISIPDGGEVPDYTHYHKIRFQMIFCRAGWVRVVYEDQGQPFVLNAGDCVLQPPEIRHRVLEASPGLEVIEITCPGVHETWADHEIMLPTGAIRPDRIYGGQRFVRYSADLARWENLGNGGFSASDIGIRDATAGLASARVVRASGPASGSLATASEFEFLMVLEGRVEIGDITLDRGDACVLPGAVAFEMESQSGVEILEVSLPA